MKKRSWNDMSLNLKILVCVAAILLVMAASTTISAVVGQETLWEFDSILEDNMACYDVQAAIDAEAKAFQNYVREASQENQANYTQACAQTWKSVEALPFAYEQLGEERYARTWNLINGYEGYCKARDALLQMEPQTGQYVTELYRVMEMQEHLADAALRLAQATLEHGSSVYSSGEQRYAVLPVLFVALFLLTIGMILVIMYTLSASVIRPMVRMAEVSRKIERNDFSGEDLPVESGDEVGELTAAFNRMRRAMAEHLTTLEVLHREEVEKLALEKDLDKTRLEMLKSQVDPHFLFNTLNMISCIARLEKAPTTDSMIVSLGNLFRYNLRTKEQIVYLDQELEMLDDYFYIQNMRHNGRIVCKKKIEVDAASVKVPSFLLQPVVENAFAHGLRSKVSGGQVFLRIWQDGARVIVSVMDNGKGMSEAELAEVRQRMQQSEQTGKSIGLGNIYRRIRMLYPEGEMRLYSKQGSGTVVQFTIPQQAP